MSVQTTIIEVDQPTAARLQAQAEAQGVTLSALLRSLTEWLSGTPNNSFSATATPEERARAVEEWANKHRSSARPCLMKQSAETASMESAKTNNYELCARFKHPAPNGAGYPPNARRGHESHYNTYTTR